MRAELAGPVPEADADAPAVPARPGRLARLRAAGARPWARRSRGRRGIRMPRSCASTAAIAIDARRHGRAARARRRVGRASSPSWRDAGRREPRAAPERAAVLAPNRRAAHRRVWHETDAEYLAKIAACQAAIREGDAYQLCLTTEARSTARLDPLDAYLRAARVEPDPPRRAAADRRASSLLSARPEQFLDGRRPTASCARSPIKGTRPRGRPRATTPRCAAELLASDKERAENLMIVDLMRNDLGARLRARHGRACTSLLAVESYAAGAPAGQHGRGHAAPTGVTVGDAARRPASRPAR